ncbi:MAG TPA: hypothetical protein VKD65_15555 [Candidatus Angelobacter sp.]|nr:hypothetical protein [Candidatus Angelobacter sp.]
MTIATDREFEERLAQLVRFYRAQRATWAATDVADRAALARWIRTGGKILEGLNESLAAIEEYSGAMELRLILDQFKAMEAEKGHLAERV